MGTQPNTLNAGVVRSDLAGLAAIARVLPGYVEGLARDVARLSVPLSPDRRVELRRIAHQLRGSGGAYGFGDITELATTVESAFDDGLPLDAVAKHIAELINLIRRVDGYDPEIEAAHGRSLAA